MDRSLLLLVILLALGASSAQNVARAAPPSAEALWTLLGSVSTIDVEIHSADVRTILVVIAYQEETVLADSVKVDPDDGPLVTVSAGALGPGIGTPPCEGGGLAFIHHRELFDRGAGGFGSGVSQHCVQVEGLVALRNHGGSAPLNRPPEYHRDHPQVVPVDTWLLFGAANPIMADRGGGAVDIQEAFTYYFMLSTEFVTPPSDQWELPAYESWREAYDAFGELP